MEKIKDFIEGLILLIIIGGGSLVLLKKTKNKNSFETKNKENEKKISQQDLDNHIQDIYSRYIPWDNSIGTKSAYVAGKKEFAKLLLDNIENKDKFLEIFNSNYINPGLFNAKLDKKYDIVEKQSGIPLHLEFNFDKFNITEGNLTDKIHQLINKWYEDGIKEVKDDIKYKVKSKDWERVKNTLTRILESLNNTE